MSFGFVIVFVICLVIVFVLSFKDIVGRYISRAFSLGIPRKYLKIVLPFLRNNNNIDVGTMNRIIY